MKKVILFALFIVGVGTIQCEESFTGKSLDELMIMHKLQKDAIKKTVEYRYAQSIQSECGVYLRLAEKRLHDCEIAIHKNMFWPWAASEDSCELASIYIEMADEKAKVLRDATDRLNESVAEDCPTFESLRVVIAERQLAIAEKGRALILAKSGQ